MLSPSTATRAPSTDRALACLDRAKARLRSGLTTGEAEKLASEATAWEDWLEVSHPRSPLRLRLRDVRRRLEARGAR